MRAFVWGFTWFLVIGWTFVAWVGHGLLGLFTGIFGAGMGDLTGFQVDPASWPGLAELARSLGEFAIIGVWAIGTMTLLAIGWIISLFFPKRQKSAPVMVPMPGKNIGGGWPTAHAERPREPVASAPFPSGRTSSGPYANTPRPADRDVIPRGSLIDRMLSRKDR